MHRGEGGRSRRLRRSQQVDKHSASVEVTQARGLDHAAQDLLGGGTARRAITTGHLSIDDGRPKRLRGAPVRGVECEIEEKAEEGGEFEHEMRREPLGFRQTTGYPAD